MMDEGNSIIYGLENQTRALSAQYAENEAVRFLIGTQSLKPSGNQVHVVELEEDTGALHTKVFKHEAGEVWHLRCSPHDPALLATTHNSYDAVAAHCTMAVSILKLSTTDVIPKDMDDLSAIQGRNAEDMELLRTFNSEKAEEEVRCAEWHGVERARLAVVTEGGARVLDAETGAAVASTAAPGRAHLKLTGGKWNPHQGHTQFAMLQDTHIKCWDTRGDAVAWSIEGAHGQLARDLDFNPNRQFQLASVGDDAALRLWDYRAPHTPIYTTVDHSHWVWSVRYNSYHEQLLLTGSSDARALLTCVASVLRDDAAATDHADDSPTLNIHDRVEDGVVQSYEQHEESVYACEWSAADPWTFASLSYDGRLVLSRVPRHFKYKILV